MAKETAAASGKKEQKAKPGLGSRLSNYLREVRVELKRVVWPSRSEVINSSIVVLVTLVFFIVFLYLVDSIIVPLLVMYSKLGA